MVNLSLVDKEYKFGVNEALKVLNVKVSNTGIKLVIKKDKQFKITKDKEKLTIFLTKESDLYVALRKYVELIDKKTYEETFFKRINELTLMLDCSRNAVYKVETVKSLIVKLTLFGYDSLQLYTEDTFQIDDEPYFGYLRGAYSKDELKEIVNYAEKFGIEVVPTIQTLAHLNGITQYHEYKELFDTDDILLVGSSKTYDFIEIMIKTAREVFNSNNINIGMDEAYRLGRGRYLDINGYQNRFDIMINHLEKVIEICNKYDFKPMMWSDMFFRLAQTNYYDQANVPKELADKIPKEVSLIYWDYYSLKQEHYETMIDKHSAFNTDIKFAGGIWKWIGFTPDNHFSIETSKAALNAVAKKNIEHVIITAWGDNGAETSLFSILPSIAYNGINKFSITNNDEEFKNGFEAVIKVPLDIFMMVDKANELTTNVSDKNSANKHFFYNDILLGQIDTAVEDGYDSLFKEHKKTLESILNETNDYKYIFETQIELLRVLSKKTQIGVRLREAYKLREKEELAKLSKELEVIITDINKFHQSLYKQWHLESKPFGFEIQDLRIGGLILRIKTAIKRINNYLSGDIKKIDELEIDLLDYYGKRLVHQKPKNNVEYRYKPIVSVGVNV